MASEERKAADNKIIQENLFKTLGAEEVQAETDAFQCGRCKQVRAFVFIDLARYSFCCRGNADIAKRKRAARTSR